MRGLELVVVLGVAVLVGSLVARRYRVAPPVLLFGCGVLLGFIPALRRAHLPPEAMLFLFLPALLFWESLTTSLREIRRNLRGIILARTVLVIATAAAVAAVAHALGLPWGPAWVLGAAVAPTDATAVAALARTAFLLAEVIHASGVLAVVVCGLVISQVGPRVIQADARQTTVAFWSRQPLCSTASFSCWSDWSCSRRSGVSPASRWPVESLLSVP